MDGLLRQVGILAHKLWRGAYNIGDKVNPLELCSLDDAMKMCWQDDAHFATYRPLHNPEVCPRCNKTVLPQLREVGEDLVTDMLVFDYDLPDHRKWQLGEFEIWLRCFNDLTQGMLDWAGRWRYLYSTAHGARVVYVLDQNIPVDTAEDYHRWVVKEMHRHRLALDSKCSDWTRVFRLPYVVRDGKNTWEEDYVKVLVQKDAVLELSFIGKEDSRDAPIYAHVPRLDLPKPAADEAQELLRDENQPTTQAKWVRRVQKRLKDKPAYPVLFDHVLLAERGNRDDTIVRLVGQTVNAVYRANEMTPQKVYALFLDPVQQLDPDPETPDWTDVLWSVILRIWAKEESRLEAQRERVRKEMAKGEESLCDIMENMKLWCDHPGLYSHDALEWVKQHLIANSGESFFVMRGDGYYDSFPVTKNQLTSRIKVLGMEGAIMLNEPNQSGTGWKRMAILDILGQHSTAINAIEAVPCLMGGHINNIDRPGATLVIPSFRRNPGLSPQFTNEVDLWLRCIFGQYYDKATQWIAWALAFEEGPICALSLAGPPGSGKKVFVRGLAETLETPALASSSDLVGQYQYGLRTSPFLVINEGWPRLQQGMHPADKFRELVGGDPIMAMEKFRHPVSIKNPVRVVFMANNMDVVKVLTANRELSPDDRQALAQRLFHIDYDESATQYLNGLGGIKFTGKIGARWVSPDGGGDSDYIVARHFLWLHEKRKALGPTGKRFLVEGEYNDDLMFAMQTQSGSTPLIIETIIQMIASGAKRPGFVVRHASGRIFILSSDILIAHRATAGGKEQFTMAMVANTLKSITMPNRHKRGYVLDERKTMGRKRWHELDLQILHDVANRDGWRCDLLATLIKNTNKKK